MLPLGFVRQEDIKDAVILKRKPDDVYTNPDGNVRLKPPTYDQTTMDEFAMKQTTTTPPEPAQILWDYHYDLMNDFDWTNKTGSPLDGKKFPAKFKYRLCHVVKTWNPILMIYDTTNTLLPWVEIDFLAVIMPNLRSGADVGLVTESEPTPAALFEGTGPPDDSLGHSGDFYFDLDTSDGGQAVLYGPKMPIGGDGDTPQNRSVGTWIIDPVPPPADLATTRAMADFARYKTKKGQIQTGMPNLEYSSVAQGGPLNGDGQLGSFANLFQSPDQLDAVPGDPFHPYIPWVPRWPTDPTGFPVNDINELNLVLTSALYRLPLFKPKAPPLDVAPMWNAASNQPVWGTDAFFQKRTHPYATTFRLGDYRKDVGTIGTGNKPWPNINRTTTAFPTFGMWTSYQKQPPPLATPGGPVFNHALLFLPIEFCPVGGREATNPDVSVDYYDEQINPVPIDCFFYDPTHPDGEYGDAASAPWPGSNMHICDGFSHHPNPSVPSAPSAETYMVQTTLIFP